MNTDLTKTILYVYPMMKSLAEAVRVGARNKALLSYRSKRDALTDLEAVAEEVLLAGRLEWLHGAVDSVLARLSKEESFLLEYRYFRRKKVLASYEGEIDCSERNYFRKQEKLLHKISARLFARGITEEYFLKAFKHSVCLMRVYRAIQRGAELTICARRTSRPIAFHGSKFSGGAAFLPCATNTATINTATADSVIKTIWTADRPSPSFPLVAGGSGSGR